MQQCHSVIQYNAITLSDYYYKLQFGAYSYIQV